MESTMMDHENDDDGSIERSADAFARELIGCACVARRCDASGPDESRARTPQHALKPTTKD
jgi:hypothetical protein